jgi:AcrR family transcriptional regulator
VTERRPEYPHPPAATPTARLRALLAQPPEGLVPPPPDSPPGRILAATRELFAEGGFAGVPVRAVAAHAGTNVAMVNYYFGSKERLVDAVLLQEIQLLLLDVVTGLDAEAPPADVLAEFPLRILASLRRDPRRLRLMRLAVSTEPERLRRLIRSLGQSGMLGVSRVLAELVMEAQADGRIPPMPPRSVLLYLVSNAYGLVFMEPIAREVVGFELDDDAQWQEHRACLAQLLRGGLLGAAGLREDGYA